MSTGLTNLHEMLSSLDVKTRPEPYVFVTTSDDDSPLVQHADATIREEEGLTVVLTARIAEEHGLVSEPLFSWLSLTINSSLEAVGLTAAFSTALAAENISCNVLAGYHHDHLLVPYADRDRAIKVLRRLSQRV